MNKSAIALAVAAALAASAAAQAETTLYGSARVSLDYVTQDITDALPDSDDELDGVWDVFNNSSRLGVKGSEDLGNGLSAIYQYEFGVDTTEGGNLNSTRPRVLGLKGGFGTVAIGNQWSPYYNVIGVSDIFNSGRSFTNYLGPFRLSNTLAYISPSMGGFEVQAALVMDGANELEDGVDAYNISGLYKNGPITAGLTYLGVEGDEDQGGDADLWGLGLGYTGGNLGVTLSYENADEGDVDLNDIYGTVSYSFGANIVRAAYGVNQFDIDGGEDDDVQHYALGFQHNLSKRSRLWVEYIGFDSDEDILDQDAISIGMRHDF